MEKYVSDTYLNENYAKLFDTHAHLCSEDFDDDRDAVVENVLRLCAGFTECSSDPEDLEKAKALAEKYEKIWFAAGIHPHSAAKYDENVDKSVIKMLSHEKCVAVGEIGLDYHYDFSPREDQIKVLKRQIAIANDADMPVILHLREAEEDMLRILLEAKPKKGILHCFSEDTEYLNKMLDLGLYIGFGGAVTFKSRPYIAESAAAVPMDRFVLETDSPYMTPVPYRGRRCEPHLAIYTARKLAELKNTDIDTVINTSNGNAERLLGISLA